MTGSKLLSETRCTTGLHHINHIALRSISVVRITAFKGALGRSTTSIIIHNHWIFLRGVEMRWQIITSINGVTSLVHIVPFTKVPKFYILQQFRIRIFQQCVGAFFRIQIQQMETVTMLGTLSNISHNWRICSERIATYYIFLTT